MKKIIYLLVGLIILSGCNDETDRDWESECIYYAIKERNFEGNVDCWGSDGVCFCEEIIENPCVKYEYTEHTRSCKTLKYDLEKWDELIHKRKVDSFKIIE